MEGLHWPVAPFAPITPWNGLLGIIALRGKASSSTLLVILAAARTVSSLGGTGWGLPRAGIVIAMVPCLLFHLLLPGWSGPTSGR